MSGVDIGCDIELDDVQIDFLSKQQNHHAHEVVSFLVPAVGNTSVNNEDEEEKHIRKITQDWIKQTFYGKECIHFISVGSDKERCKCGRLKEQHQQYENTLTQTISIENDKSPHSQSLCGNSIEMSIDSASEWNSKIHTKSVQNLCFGSLEFSCDHYDEDVPDGMYEVVSTDTARFLRVPDDIPISSILIWLQQIWDLKRPKLLLSFLGGHENFRILPQLQNRLQSSVMRLLQSSEVWLFTDGTNVGLSEIIGNTYKSHQISACRKKGACIGFVTWGAISGQSRLYADLENPSLDIYKPYYAPHASEPDGIRANYLDKHHTHHLLVDNGTYGIHGGANTLRHDLLLSLSCQEEGEGNIPAVLVLVGGGLPTVNDIYLGLISTPIIPTIVVKDSGRLADVFAKLIEYHEQNKHLPVAQKSKRVRKLIQRYLQEDIDNIDNYEADFDSYVEKIKTCIEEHDRHIIIYDDEEGPCSFQQSILIACKGLNNTGGTQLNINQLAILWEEGHMVETSKIEEVQKFKMLEKALTHNRVESVRLLLESGINLQKFLQEDFCPIGKLYSKAFNRGSIILSHMMTDDEITRSRDRARRRKNCFEMKIIHRILTKMTDEDYTPEQIESGKYPLENILMWSIIAYQPEMARCLYAFCSHSPMVTALMLSRIYRYIFKLKRFRGEVESSAVLEYQYFADFAVNLLSVYARTNEDLARECLTMSHPLWGFKDAMLLAVNTLFKKFIAHQLSQKVLKDIWRGFFNEHKMITEQRLVWEKRRRISSFDNLYVMTSASDNSVRYRKSVKYDGGAKTNQKNKTPRLCAAWSSKILTSFLYLFLVPRGKFISNLVIYLLFVSLFSHVVINKMSSTKHSVEEYLTAVMVVSYMLDELRQIAIVKKATGSQKFRKWIKNVWNILDAWSIILFAVGFFLRYYESTLLYGRVVYALNIIVWFLKIFQFYRVSAILGPYVVMIYRMFHYLLSFIMVLLVVVVAYGIFQHALLYPNENSGWNVMFKMLFRPYMAVFGELGVGHTLQADVTIFETEKYNTVIESVSIVGMCVYVMISNILLINLLIAVFNNIYTEIESNTDTIWKFERYDMIMEFQDKPVLPPPLSIFENIYTLVKLAVNKIARECSCVNGCFRCGNEADARSKYTAKALTNEILEFERRCMKMHLYEMFDEEKYSLNSGTKHLRQRLDSHTKILQSMSEKVTDLLHHTARYGISLQRSSTSVLETKRPSPKLYDSDITSSNNNSLIPEATSIKNPYL